MEDLTFDREWISSFENLQRKKGRNVLEHIYRYVKKVHFLMDVSNCIAWGVKYGLNSVGCKGRVKLHTS